MDTQPDSPRSSLPAISAAEHASVHQHLPALLEAIDATQGHRDAHTGVVMHALVSRLSQDEQAVALAYLQSVVFWKLN